MKFKVTNIENVSNVFLNGNEEHLIGIKNQIKKINPQININQGKYIPLNIEDFNKEYNYLVFSGIGNHKTFINMLKNNNLKIVDDLEYPDHYQYSQKDFKEILNKAKKYHAKIITTEKDYLRLDSVDKTEVLFIKSTLEIIDEKNFIQTLINLNENN